MSQAEGWRAPVVVALAAGFALRLYLAFATPVGGASVPGKLSSYNDELAHVHYIERVAQTGKLPSHVESIQGDNALAEGHYENYQPPLYYVGGAKLARVFGFHGTDQFTWAGRLINLPLFAALLMLWLAIGAEARLKSAHVDGALIFLALSGIAVRFTSTASNDTLFWVIAGAMIWTALRMWNAETSGRHLLLFALLAVAGLYTKLTVLLLLPLPLLMLWKSRHLGLIIGLLLMYGFIGIVTGPLWMRNVAEFGSWMPLNAGFGAPEYAIPPWEAVTYAIRSFVFPWSEFWRGWMGLALMLPAVLLMALSAVSPPIWRSWRTQPVTPVALALAFLAFVWLNVQYRQAEARYLFAAWPALAMMVSQPVRDSEGGLWLFLIALLLPYGMFLIPFLGI
jgi:hypothetical protein